MAGIYIHIPFCRKLCNYCDFYHIISPDDKKPLLNALSTEAEERRAYLNNEIVSTIYIGGGTPSVLSVSETDGILEFLKSWYHVSEDCETTIELNPDDISDSYIRELRKTHINRISLGVQSWHDKDLKLLNRRHTAQQASDALEKILRAGFGNVTIDLIYGIPGMETHGWIANLDKSLSFGIKHLSAYHLTIEPGTVLYRMKEKGLFKEVEEEESVAQFHMLIEKAEAAGFIHYEISNFGKQGFFSLHNTNYWKQVPYLGLGPSAHSFNGFSRQWNMPDVKNYINNINEGKKFYDREELDMKTRFNEYIMVSLRTMWGIDLGYIEKTFEKEGYDYIINLAGKFINYGMLKQENNCLVLTNQGKMISDNIISEFIMAG